MRDLWLVAKYTFQDLVKRKSFIISNIIIFLIMIIAFNVPNIINKIQGDDESFGKNRLAIIDEDNIYEGSLKQLEELGDDIGYEIEIVENTALEEVKEKINQEELDEAIRITKGENGIHIEYIVKSMSMMSEVPQDLITILQDTYKNLQISKLQITPQQLSIINMPFEMEVSQTEEKEVGGNI